MIHPKAWLAWLAAAVVALTATRNPLYLLLILACIHATGLALRPLAKSPPLPLSLRRLGLLIIVVSTAFNGLTAHVGRTVLLRLPAGIPLLGGPVTLEAAAFGALNGLLLVGFLAAFAVLNQALSVQDLIRLVPRAFFPVAVVLSIAVAYVPTTLAHFQQVREAQAVRGHRVRGVRDWLPLLLPLLVGGLERAMQLAEAMTARGFAAASQQEGRTGADRTARLALPLGLALLLAGLLLRLAPGMAQPANGLVAAGALAVLAALWLAGRQVRRTVYRPQPWTGRDWAVLLAAAVVLVAYLMPWPALAYTPYPRLAWPPFNLPLALATLALLAPALLLGVWRAPRALAALR